MNVVVLIGNLTRDPDLRYTTNGKAVCKFTLAVDREYNNRVKAEREAQGYPTVDFIKVNVWGRQGEMAAQYLGKGSKCGITGRLQVDQYQTKDGYNRNSTEVFAERVEFLSGRKNSHNANVGEDYQEEEPEFTEMAQEEFPF